MRGYRIAVIEFSANWCEACQSVKHAYGDLATHYPDIFFGTVDVDRDYEISQKYNIKSLPTFLIFYNQVPNHSYIGSNQINHITATLDGYKSRSE